jgi:HPt (histidine-containing phosphotransfer) domain-containing protein
MDDVQSKPLDTERLAALLAGLRTRPAPAPPEPPAPSVDVDNLMAQAGGDRDLIADIAAAYVEAQATILEPIVRAIEAADPSRLEQAARQLRGTFGTLAAPRAGAAARRLELIGRDGDLGPAAGALELLRAEMERLEADLESIAGARPPR